MKYNVHLYPVVRLKVCDIEAESQIEAIDGRGELARRLR